MVTEIGPRYSVTAYWGPRGETCAELAARFLRTLGELANAGPAFRNWLVFDFERQRLLDPPDPALMTTLVSERVMRADDGTPTPQSGYGMTATNTSERSPTTLTLSVDGGNTFPDNYFINVAHLMTEPLNDENAQFVDLPTMRAAVLAFVSAWDATWCGARPAGLNDFESRPKPWRPWFGLEWITYISPRFAPLVTPPRSAIVERVPGGGLLMIATEERFSTDNPTHMAVARDIEAAMAPVNALPWPPDYMASGTS